MGDVSRDLMPNKILLQAHANMNSIGESFFLFKNSAYACSTCIGNSYLCRQTYPDMSW